MKQLLILSGKGGTGKTTVAGAFIKLAHAKAFADCDVDAPNLHLLMKQDHDPICTSYYGMPKAAIDTSICTQCGICLTYCRFHAIRVADVYQVNLYDCEGCGVCEVVCPVQAVSMQPAAAGELRLYNGDSVFSTAQLAMGNGTSGRLVTEVKRQLEDKAPRTVLAVIDGSPGIGCPVIASLSGVDMALIVAEPSISGLSDMERIIRTAATFQTKIAVCVNKYDTDLSKTKSIEAFCCAHRIPVVGRIPYDTEAVHAVNDGVSVVDIDCSCGRAICNIFGHTMKLLLDEESPMYKI